MTIQAGEQFIISPLIPSGEYSWCCTPSSRENPTRKVFIIIQGRSENPHRSFNDNDALTADSICGKYIILFRAKYAIKLDTIMETVAP